MLKSDARKQLFQCFKIVLSINISKTKHKMNCAIVSQSEWSGNHIYLIGKLTTKVGHKVGHSIGNSLPHFHN
jgi:hypothetical protein